MLIISAGTPDFRPMMDECNRRAQQLGYQYVARELEPSADLEAPTGVPPATFKPALIREASAAVPEGELFAWIDGDAIVVRDLFLVPDFDVAVTLRIPEEVGASGRPDTDDVNAGVVFFRQNHRTQAFLHAWEFATRFFRGDQHALSALLRQFAGFSGPAPFKAHYGGLLPIDGLEVLVLPALEWNCWYFRLPLAMRRHARILHFKSGFRKTHAPDWWRGELQRLEAVP